MNNSAPSDLASLGRGFLGEGPRLEANAEQAGHGEVLPAKWRTESDDDVALKGHALGTPTHLEFLGEALPRLLPHHRYVHSLGEGIRVDLGRHCLKPPTDRRGPEFHPGHLRLPEAESPEPAGVLDCCRGSHDASKTVRDDRGGFIVHHAEQVVDMLRQYGGGARREGFAIAPAVILDDAEIGQVFHYWKKALRTIHGAMH